MGWTSPLVIGAIGGGIAVLAAFCLIETRVAEPMFRLSLFRIRAFTAGNVSSLLAGLGRGGLMFILIIWLQGIYLPWHGYSFARTPLWAGIAMLPLTVGFLIAGPASGWLSDRFGARPFATGGMLVAAFSFAALLLLPVNFVYWQFALILLLNGIGMGLFASPNRAGIMNSLPPEQRGVGAGMSATFQNSALVLSIGIFFTLIILGLAGSLPGTLQHGLVAQGVPAADAARVASLPRGLRAVCLAARLQPGADAARARDQAAARVPRRLPDRPFVLPHPDRAVLLPRPHRRLRFRRGHVRDRGAGLAAARREVRASRPGGGPGARPGGGHRARPGDGRGARPACGHRARPGGGACPGPGRPGRQPVRVARRRLRSVFMTLVSGT